MPGRKTLTGTAGGHNVGHGVGGSRGASGRGASSRGASGRGGASGHGGGRGGGRGGGPGSGRGGGRGRQTSQQTNITQRLRVSTPDPMWMAFWEYNIKYERYHGPIERPSYADLLLHTMSLPALISGFDDDDALLPMDHGHIQELRKRLLDKDDWNWKMPKVLLNRIRDSESRLVGAMFGSTKNGWDALIKKHVKNASFVLVHQNKSVRVVSADLWGVHFGIGHNIGRIVWVLNDELNKQEAAQKTVATIKGEGYFPESCQSSH
ncbi:hypothetical protein SEMRO_1166_G248260.1 [Seminavis robusta]|uniref:Uncharacterized protein n=1 Tax=Seminavis robusta TaxID=568900 RepID=A0A9N8EGJ3_9STRA|nr:hypothetical protein SEMRO_1166_G248260.1 [Seminavis robusta]|eukprot:Sro1166_g248260.1 n/a (264) ;mRNA; f:26345-27136